jgi:outer membrane protein
MKRSILILLTFWLVNDLYAQEKWDLRKCVEYALSNNISVRQADLQIRFSSLDYIQSKAGRLPSLNFGSNTGLSFGRRENPTTGVLEDQNFSSVNFNLQSGVTLFNWFSLKNTAEANRLTIEANLAQSRKVRDDVALNVAVAYLQVLLAREQNNLAFLQVGQSRVELELTRKQIKAGNLPELNAAELEAQIARDSSTLISTQATAQQFLLQLKALLNLDAGLPFDIETPSIDRIPVENLADLQPEAVFASAVQNLPQQVVNRFRIESAAKRVQAARGDMFPTISGFGNLGTNYIYFKRPQYAPVIVGYNTTQLRANAGGNFYAIEAPVISNGAKVGEITPPAFGSQLSSNFGQNIGLGIQVPIFNGRAARTNWDRSKLNLQQLELQKESDQQTLKQDIYKAYTDATSALQKFNANRKTVEATEKAYNFAQKRYGLSLLSTYELLNSLNNLNRAKIEMLYAQYDYVFKMKLLEFYKGQGLKL